MLTWKSWVKTELWVTHGIRGEIYIPHDTEIITENWVLADLEIISEISVTGEAWNPQRKLRSFYPEIISEN
jgi:hypothetical protein